MTKYAAIKIHYDHRKELQPYLKYSKLPSKDEYESYIALYENGVGGHGFHECLNFRAVDDRVKIYLPPTCCPKSTEDEIVFFSFIYKGDKEQSDTVVGVHGGARFLGRDGVYRDDGDNIGGVEKLFYHAESPSELVTLFGRPLAYSRDSGRYTPRFRKWGYGLRYITSTHARAILTDALAHARLRAAEARNSEEIHAESEVDVLRRIILSCELEAGGDGAPETSHPPPLPDRLVGALGEKLIYEEEIRRARANDLSPERVKWISQTIPWSPYDIETVRLVDGEWKPHFIEVKTSSADTGENVYVSSQQIEFFNKHKNDSIFILVSINRSGLEVNRLELNIDDLLDNFSLTPIKFKLSRK